MSVKKIVSSLIPTAIVGKGVNIYQQKVSWVRGWANLVMRGQRLLTY